DGIRDLIVTGVQTCALPICRGQFNVLLWSIVGYALFYFVRNNLSTAMPVMEEKLGIGKPQLGLFLTLHQLLYGVSKFFNGFVGRSEERRVGKECRVRMAGEQ